MFPLHQLDNLLGVLHEGKNTIVIADYKPSYRYHCDLNGALRYHFFSLLPQLYSYYRALLYMLEKEAKTNPNIDISKLNFKCIVYNENYILEFDPANINREIYGFYVSIISKYVHPGVIIDADYVSEKLRALDWWFFYPLSDREINAMLEEFF